MHESEGRAVHWPQAAGRRASRNFNVVAVQRLADLPERLRGVWQPHLQVLVLAGLLTAEQVEGPARSDVPRCSNLAQQGRQLRGMP